MHNDNLGAYGALSSGDFCALELTSGTLITSRHSGEEITVYYDRACRISSFPSDSYSCVQFVLSLCTVVALKNPTKAPEKTVQESVYICIVLSTAGTS